MSLVGVPSDAHSFRMSQYIFTLAIILLGLIATQVSSFVHHKDVAMIQRRLGPTDRCFNTTAHPTGFSDCPPVPFPYFDEDYETEKTAVRILLNRFHTSNVCV